MTPPDSKILEPSVDFAQIERLIDARKFGLLKAALCEMELHVLTETLIKLGEKQEQELAIAFRVLPTEVAAEILGHFEPDQQEDLLTRLSDEKVAEIINEMPPDDRTELFEDLPGSLAQKLMNQLRGTERKVAIELFAYPEDSIGRLMTPEYLAVRKDWTVDMVLRHIRKVAQSRETCNVIYVVDDSWHLEDEIYLEDIVLAEPDQLVEELMDNRAGFLRARDDQETAVDAFKKYDALALPVIDNAGTLVGIVTFDDVMDLQEEESTEDMQKMAGMAALENAYLSAGFWEMIRSRLPWLILLLAAETVAVVVLKGYESMLIKLAMFMPLINATAGNTGSQIAGLMIRSIALNEVAPVDWLRVFKREFFRGMTMGVILAVLACVIVLIFGRPASVGVAVGIAMVCAVGLANLLGAMLPFAFRKIGVDPAVTSGPFIACLMDVSSILIFFSIATAILKMVS